MSSFVVASTNVSEYALGTISGQTTNISMNSIHTNAYPMNTTSNYNFGYLRSMTQYKWNVGLNNSSYGSLALSYPYTAYGTSITMNWIGSAQYGYFTLVATPTYPHTFTKWALGSTGGPTYSTSATISPGYSDSSVASYSIIYAIFT